MIIEILFLHTIPLGVRGYFPLSDCRDSEHDDEAFVVVLRFCGTATRLEGKKKTLCTHNQLRINAFSWVGYKTKVRFNEKNVWNFFLN